jgi:hypothetical protein
VGGEVAEAALEGKGVFVGFGVNGEDVVGVGERGGKAFAVQVEALLRCIGLLHIRRMHELPF